MGIKKWSVGVMDERLEVMELLCGGVGCQVSGTRTIGVME
jgi:hypothetical protein